MVRSLLRAVILLMVLVAAAAFLLGWKWGGEPRADGGAGRNDRRQHGAGARGRRGDRRAHGGRGQRSPPRADGRQITAKIKAKMALDDTVKALDVNVDTSGSTVTVPASSTRRRRASASCSSRAKRQASARSWIACGCGDGAHTGGTNEHQVRRDITLVNPSSEGTCATLLRFRNIYLRMTHDELVEGFEGGTLAPGAFGHREHLRLAWIYLQRYGRPEAERRLLAGLRAFAARAGKPEKFDAGLTLAWVARSTPRPPRSPRTFVRRAAAAPPSCSIAAPCARPPARYNPGKTNPWRSGSFPTSTAQPIESACTSRSSTIRLSTRPRRTCSPIWPATGDDRAGASRLRAQAIDADQHPRPAREAETDRPDLRRPRSADVRRQPDPERPRGGAAGGRSSGRLRTRALQTRPRRRARVPARARALRGRRGVAAACRAQTRSPSSSARSNAPRPAAGRYGTGGARDGGQGRPAVGAHGAAPRRRRARLRLPHQLQQPQGARADREPARGDVRPLAFARGTDPHRRAGGAAERTRSPTPISPAVRAAASSAPGRRARARPSRRAKRWKRNTARPSGGSRARPCRGRPSGAASG